MIRATMLLIAAAVVLAGCAAPVERLVTVKVPVPVPCDVKVPERPAMPLEAIRAPYTVDAWIGRAIAQDGLRAAYELELETALGACVAHMP